MTSHCPKCGSNVSDGADQCPKCGVVFRKYELHLAKRRGEFAAKTTPENGETQPTSTDNFSSKIPKHKIGIASGIALIILTLLLLTQVPVSKKNRPLSPHEALSAIRPSLVTIQILDSEKFSILEYAGFFCDDGGHVITCSNVFRKARSAEIKLSDGKRYSPKLVVSEDAGSGLLKLLVDMPASSSEPVTPAESSPGEGERVFLLDGREEVAEKVIETRVAASIKVPTLGTGLQLAMPIPQNLYGSPVFNSAAKMIGVVTTLCIDGQDAAFVVPARYQIRLEQENVNIAFVDWLKPRKEAIQNSETTVVVGQPRDNDKSAHEEFSETLDQQPIKSPTEKPRGTDLEKQLDKKTYPKNVIERVCNATVTVKTPLGFGSGFFVTKNGYILTNRHVIASGDEYKVNFNRELEKTNKVLADRVEGLQKIERDLNIRNSELRDLQSELNRMRSQLQDIERRLSNEGGTSFGDWLRRDHEQLRREYNQKVEIFERGLNN